MKKVTVLIFILMTASFSESFSLKDYIYMKNKADKASNQAISVYIDGIGEGLSWANGTLNNKYGISLYCQPVHLALNANNYMAILDRAVEKTKDPKFLSEYQDKAVLGLLLLKELQNVFPCDNK